jgi:hypothetical protein
MPGAFYVHGPWYPLVGCVRYAEKTINENLARVSSNHLMRGHAFRYNRQ